MVITIFGATGLVGSRLVKQALAQGFVVKAFGRNVSNLIDADLLSKNLEAIKGYVLDEDDVLKALKGSEAVLSALGGGIDGTDRTRSLGIKNIVRQMNKAGTNRIVAIGGLGVLGTTDDKLIMDLSSYPQEYVAVAKEHYAAYMHLLNSNLNWTFVCPPNINNEDGNGNYVTNLNRPPSPDLNRIAAGNLAAFMLNELKNNQYLNQRVGISDTN